MARKKGNRKVVQKSEFSDEEDYKTGASVNRWETAGDVELDSEDEFHKQREMIDLGDDNNEEESEEEEGNEEVFGLDGVSSDDDDDDVDLGIYKVENNEDIIEKEKYKEIDEKAWGKRRDIYYNADDADADDEIAKEEEYEALRLQKERIDQLDEEDFLDDSFAAKLSGKTDIDVDLDKESEEEEGDEQDEIVNKNLKENISKMSKDEQLSIIFNQTPEMLELIEDYKEKLNELKEKIIPILKMIEKDEIRNSLEKKTVKYLKFKYQLIISYLTNISFYLVLRSSTSANKIKEHPVISTLVDIKLILDKIEKEVEGKEEENKKKRKKNNKPKEKTIIAKMIDELMRQVTEGRPEDDSQEIHNKLLAEVHEEFSNDDEEEENDEEIDNNIDNEETQLSSILSSERNENKKKKNEKHVKISEEVQEYSDSDYEERFISLKSENNKTKKSKKNKKERKSEDFNEAKVNEDDDELDEGDKKKNSLRFHASNINKSLSKLSGKKSTGDLDVPYKRKDKKEISEEVKKSRESADADIFDDTDDLDLNDGLDINSNLRSNKRPREEDEIDNDFVDDFNDEDLQYYEDISNAAKEKKRVKEENFRKIKQELLEESMIDENDLAPGEKRHINKTIEKNRGLTPHRKREKKNPRVKHRKNYEKAMIKLKSFRRVAVNKGEVGPYAGETTGIKTKLSRSVRFTN